MYISLFKQEQGYEFCVEGLMETYYGTLVLISADNPASCALGGFKEGSSAYRYCRHCMGKAEQTRTEVIYFCYLSGVVCTCTCVCNQYSHDLLYIQFNDSSFKLRNLTRHLRHCTLIEEDNTKSRKYGVNRRALLLELQYFDMCCGTLIPDVMHDVLEGYFMSTFYKPI